jgi:hypothetical protein
LRQSFNSLSCIHAGEEHERKILRQDLQDLQDEVRQTELSPNGAGLFLVPHPLFHPVNPVNPVKKKWTPSFRPLGAESKMDFAGLLSFVFLSVCRSLCALKPFGKERTSGVLHSPSSLSLFLGFPTLPPQAV